MINKGFYQFGKFTLDQESGLFLYENEPIKLAPKVYQVLLLLVKNSGRIISKDEIFAELWAETFVEENALSYTISQLRKAIAVHEPDANLIETIPRRGFRFVGDVVFVENAELEKTPQQNVVARQVIEEIWIEEIDDQPQANAGQQLMLPAADSSNRRYILAGTLIGLLLLFAGGFWFYKIREVPNTTKSIAVLPLNDISDQQIEKSLSQGITFALISQLGRSDLIVRPLNSTIAAAANTSDPIEIGRRLSVDAVIDWNIQKLNDRYRVNASLLRVADGKQLWSETFDHDISDIFLIQDAVSQRTAESLISNLTDAESRRLHQRITENNEAYQAYLRGRFHWNKRNREGFNSALNYFEQAVSLDPKFAQAHAGIADVHLGFYDYGYKNAGDSIPLATAAVNRALRLNPELAEAYSTLASIEFLHNRNWKTAEEHFLRAIKLAPRDATPKMRLGWMLSVGGRSGEGLFQLKEAEKIDPTSRLGQTNIAYNLMISGKLDEAEQKLIAVNNESVDFSLSHWYLGTIYFIQGKENESIEQYFKAYEIDAGKDENVATVKQLYLTKGRDTALAAWSSELEQRYATSYFPPSNIALVAAFARNRDQTIKWLKESENMRDPWLFQIVHDPEYSFVKNDPDFIAILNSVKPQ